MRERQEVEAVLGDGDAVWGALKEVDTAWTTRKGEFKQGDQEEVEGKVENEVEVRDWLVAEENVEQTLAAHDQQLQVLFTINCHNDIDDIFLDKIVCITLHWNVYINLYMNSF